MAVSKDKAKATAEMVREAIVGENVSALTFSKSQIIKSQRYAARHDALNALLKDDKEYLFSEVDEILKQFDEGGEKQWHLVVVNL